MKNSTERKQTAVLEALRGDLSSQTPVTWLAREGTYNFPIKNNNNNNKHYKLLGRRICLETYKDFFCGEVIGYNEKSKTK